MLGPPPRPIPPLSTSDAQYFIAVLLCLQPDERVGAMDYLLRLTSTPLESVYLLWRLNTIWPLPPPSPVRQDLSNDAIAQITWAVLHTPAETLRVAELGGALRHVQVVELLRAARQLQTTAATALLPLPIPQDRVGRVYGALAAATPPVREAAAEWLRANPHIPWTDILTDMLTEFPYVTDLPSPWPTIPCEIALMAAGLVTSGYVVALGEPDAPVAPWGVQAVHRAIMRASKRMFPVAGAQDWPLSRQWQ
jgi:hypothetical protein